MWEEKKVNKQQHFFNKIILPVKPKNQSQKSEEKVIVHKTETLRIKYVFFGRSQFTSSNRIDGKRQAKIIIIIPFFLSINETVEVNHEKLSVLVLNSNEAIVIKILLSLLGYFRNISENQNSRISGGASHTWRKICQKWASSWTSIGSSYNVSIDTLSIEFNRFIKYQRLDQRLLQTNDLNLNFLDIWFLVIWFFRWTWFCFQIFTFFFRVIIPDLVGKVKSFRFKSGLLRALKNGIINKFPSEFYWKFSPRSSFVKLGLL